MSALPAARLLLAALMLASGGALAQNQFTLGELQPGQILLNLSATEQQQVPQDTLNTVLEFSAQGRDRVDLQDQVNRALRGALDLLQDAGEDVTYNTTQYQVYVIDAGRPSRADVETPVWRAQQGIALSGTDTDEVLELTGKLQSSGLVVVSQYFSLSSARYEEVTAGMLQAALQKLQERADSAARALGKANAQLVEVSLDGSPNFAFAEMSYRAVAMEAAAMAPPVAAPGETQVSLTVAARAVLSP